MNIDFDVRESPGLSTFGVRATAGLKEEIRDILNQASSLALQHMAHHVPRGRLTYSGQGNKKTIFSSLGRTNIRYFPGGPGGGGNYRVTVGAINDPPDHTRWVTRGTSNYGGLGNMGKVMTIQKLGEPVRFRVSRKGQDPQTEWYEQAFKNAQAYIFARLQTLDLMK